MRKVAGSLRLDLASYRELEAFAQLGTELDPATQAKLDRGARMVELLKQPQYQPMHVADQVISIYAGAKGHLDAVPVAKVPDFERFLLEKIHDTHPEVRKRIVEEKTVADDLEPKLNQVIAGIRDAFSSGKAYDPR
jgi:F-type H+-transporting ATPase subunit alpha